MGKKKRKIFQKSQLLSLFHNKNYQKVISKIKQFEIDGISAEELRKIQLTSYEKLAEANFESGDINRAMRDIESLLNIDDSDEYRLIKLKYLCYMEHFNNALSFAEDLIVSKNLKIKKEAMFLYLLANIYSGSYEIDAKNLKLLPMARQNYILGFVEFLKGNTEESLLFFDKCNPRAKIEKENINAIKSIVLKQDSKANKSLKPLYRFLINGDDVNLQNTKSSREIKKDILSQFVKNKGKKDIENLIALKSSTTVKIITNEIKDREQQAKLIYNNIILLIEKQRNLSDALDMFIKNKSSLIQFVESGFLFIQIKSLLDDRKSDKIIVSFFSSYLKLHHKKLSEFQLDFIFFFLLRTQKGESTAKLIDEYGGEDILFLIRDMVNIEKIEQSHQEIFNKIMKKYSLLKDTALNGLADYINVLDDNIDKMNAKEKVLLKVQLSQFLILFEACPKRHQKYQATLLKILSNISKVIQNFEFSKNSELYIQLSEVINRFIEINKIDKSDLSEDIEALFTSIEKKKSIKKEKKSDDKNMFDLFKHIVNEYEDDFDDMLDGFDVEYLDDKNLARIKKDFIEALKNNQNPFNFELEDIEESFSNHIVFEFILDLVSKAIEYGRYDTDFIQTLLDNMGIEPQESYYREDLIVAIKKHAKKDIKTALIFLDDCITMTAKKDRETVWYLKWLEAYVYLVDDYKQEKDRAFKACLHHFIVVQQKKRFKTLNARFEKIIDRFKDKGLF